MDIVGQAVIARGLTLPASFLGGEQRERAIMAGLSFSELATLIVQRDGYAGQWWGLVDDGDTRGYRSIYAAVPVGRSLVDLDTHDRRFDTAVLGVIMVADVPDIDGHPWSPAGQVPRPEAMNGTSYLPAGLEVTVRRIDYTAGDGWRSVTGIQRMQTSPLSLAPLTPVKNSRPLIDVVADRQAREALISVRAAVHRAVESAETDADRSRMWASTAKSAAIEVVMTPGLHVSTGEKARLLLEEAAGLEAAAAATLRERHTARSRVRNDFPAPAGNAAQTSRTEVVDVRVTGGRRARPVIER